jgi:thiamine kinase-like enzyme
MNNDQLKKLIAYTKDMPEMFKIMKHFVLDYISLKEQNKKLVETNLKLLEEMVSYEERISEQLNTELVIH